MNPTLALLGLVLFLLAGGYVQRASAHDEPTSFIDIRLKPDGMQVDVTASVTDLAHDLPNVEPDMLLQRANIDAQQSQIAELVAARLKISDGGNLLALRLGEIIPVVEKRDLRMVFSSAWPVTPETLRVHCLLFSYDPRHRTFVNIYADHEILRQDVLTAANTGSTFQTSNFQSIPGVFRTFVGLGIHHIFIGPDHILFVVGLMLLGGSLQQLLKIITAFTIAHSITLALATFRILSPSASIIEPTIALSIVFVGVHAFFGKQDRDPRLLFAFCFGLVHGFGFANVLQEMVLPRQALGCSLCAFNLGVEIGQGCIVLAVAPLLAFLQRGHAQLAGRVVAAGSLCVTAAGAFWFFQRIIG